MKIITRPGFAKQYDLRELWDLVCFLTRQHLGEPLCWEIL